VLLKNYKYHIIGDDNMTFTYRHKKELIMGLIILIIISISIFLIIKYRPKPKKESKKETIEKNIVEEKEEKVKAEKEEEYKVDIKGAVITPGLYSLPKSSRVIDVINKAGGLKDNANTTPINLSLKIKDEMVIIIYTNEEVENFVKTKEKEARMIKECNEFNNLRNDACINTKPNKETKVEGKININTATKEELNTLPGIGSSKAKSIIEYREKVNGFKEIDELKKVEGIGEELFAKIKENIII
jgi:competence protein comEA helix-hairpin-helix repeat region